jgi:hypothetical protein
MASARMICGLFLIAFVRCSEFLGRSLHGGFGLTGSSAFQFKLSSRFHVSDAAVVVAVVARSDSLTTSLAHFRSSFACRFQIGSPPFSRAVSLS